MAPTTDRGQSSCALLADAPPFVVGQFARSPGDDNRYNQLQAIAAAQCRALVFFMGYTSAVASLHVACRLAPGQANHDRLAILRARPVSCSWGGNRRSPSNRFRDCRGGPSAPHPSLRATFPGLAVF